MSPVRLGSGQDDGKAFWVLCFGVGGGSSSGGSGGGKSGGRSRIGGVDWLGVTVLGPWGRGRVARDKRWEEVLDDCVSYGMYGPRGKHSNALGRTRRLPGAPRFDGVL